MSEPTYLARRLSSVPDLLAVHETAPGRYPFLLESAARGTSQGRHSILFAFPGEVLESDGEGDFFARLDQVWQQDAIPESGPGEVELPFTGGWFLFLAYEAAGMVEPTLNLPRDPEQSSAWAVRIPAAIVVDHAAEVAWLISEVDDPDRIALMAEDVEAAGRGRAAVPGNLLREPLREDPPGDYCEAVTSARRYIRDGDVFQANLSRRWSGELAAGLGPADVYRRLRQSNPGPFAGLAIHGERAIISSSPERLVSRRGGWVDTRPIAGTRPRGDGEDLDQDLRRELIGHPKERAEHIMLIDLERNDLGRICEPGSVEANELMVLETYAHVHHIVSNVRGRLRSGVSPGDTLRAVFPGGTITGCPKVRCMEIIGELEGRPRGAYTGALGYLNRDGSLDSNILIRTVETRGRNVQLLAGAGIVADSIPDRELEETRAKARGMILALQDSA